MSALVAWLVSPLGVALCLLLAGLVAAWPIARQGLQLRCAYLALVLGTAWLLLWSLPPASHAIRLTLEDAYPALPVARLPSADAIVVLGGGVVPPVLPYRPEPEVDTAGDRVAHAARLYHAGKAPWVLASGGHGNPHIVNPGDGEAGAMRALLVQWGVPADRIVIEPASRNTEQNARYAAKLLRARGASRVLLVTSALHMPRAVQHFERQGLVVIAATTDVEVDRTELGLGGGPSAAALAASGRAFKEWVGILALRLGPASP